MSTKNPQVQRRINRVRAKINGTSERPRVAVERSIKYIRVQLIDDTKGHTLLAVSDTGVKAKGTKTQKAAALGAELAKQAQAKQITKVVFDRRGNRYHGRIKALAEAARLGGLQF